MVLSLLLVVSLPGRAEDVTDREFDFAAGLIKLGFPDFAETVVNKLVMGHTNLNDRANVIRAEALVKRQRFKQAEDIVAAMPKDSFKAQAIMLALADGYYQAGQYDRCTSLYRDFFRQYTNSIPTDPDLLRFYSDAAYKFGQMLAQQNDPKGAADIYSRLLTVVHEPDRVRQIRLEHAELLLKAAGTMSESNRETVLTNAEADCSEILWGNVDLWFGRGIIAEAQLKMLRGRKDEAVALLQSNMRVLTQLDGLLKETNIPISESPFAGARSLLGSLYMDEADILLGSKERREAEALVYFDRALTEIDVMWNLIVRINKRDAAILAAARKDAREPPTLPGTASQRMKPFDDIAAELKQYDDAVARYSEQGWEAKISDKANALKDRIRKLGTAIAEYPRGVGVTPGPDVVITEAFKGRAYLNHALTFLAAEDARKEKGIGLDVKALQEFYEVFAGYPGSAWNAPAGEKVAALKERLKQLTGKEVTIEARKGGRKKMALVALREGHNLFGRKEYQKAIDQYIKALNESSEDDESLVALGNLMECYANLKDALYVKVTAEYVAERFAARPEAAQAILRIGRFYVDSKNRDMYRFVYELYLNRFPDHPSGATVLYMLGEQRWMVQDYEGAVVYYRRVTEHYVNTPFFIKALYRIGWSYYMAKNFPKAATEFAAYLGEAQPSADKAQAKLCLADACRQMNNYTNALTQYRELCEWLSRKDNAFSSSTGELETNRGILEQATFLQAYCLSRMTEPADQVAANRKAAVEGYRKFLDQYPKSKLAPAALSSMGAVLLSEGKSDEAAKVFDELSAKYPESEAGQNARFAMVQSLLDIGQNEKARLAFAEMMKDAAKYSGEQFTRLGQLLQDKGENESAARAFAKAVEIARAPGGPPETAKSRADMEQRALLLLGKTQIALGHFEDAAKSLNDLVTRYPRSGLFFEARFLLSGAYRQLGKLNDATDALGEIFKRAPDQTLINRATIDLASIQSSQGDNASALASYQRIVLLGKKDDPDTRPLYKEALVKSIPLFLAVNRWQDAIEDCNLYTAQFPSGEGIEQVRQWRAKAMMGAASGGEKTTGEKK